MLRDGRRALLLVLVGALAAPASAEEGGTIKGKVSATPAKYLPQTVVYLKEVPGHYSPKTHAMDQKKLVFMPHVLAITQGDTIDFLNGDNVGHNVFSPEAGYNFGTFSPGEKRSHTFGKPGAYTQLCSLHPDMLAYVFVGQNPYSTVVAKDGSFRIQGVPAGSWQLAVWNPQLKAPAQSVTVAGGKSVEVNLALKR